MNLSYCHCVLSFVLLFEVACVAVAADEAVPRNLRVEESKPDPRPVEQPPPPPRSPPAQASYREGEILVKFTQAARVLPDADDSKDDAKETTAKDANREHRQLNEGSNKQHVVVGDIDIVATKVKYFDRLETFFIELDDDQMMSAEEAVAAYEHSPLVDWITLNYMDQLEAQSKTWGFRRIDANALIGGFLGIGGTRIYDFGEGEDVLVGVIDSGVLMTHEDLEDNIWTNPGEIPGNGIDDDGNGYVDDVHGYDFHDDDNDPTDMDNHGTHVSGIIAAVDNNKGILGVNPHAIIVPLKVTPDVIPEEGFASVFAIEAINYCINMNIKILNYSSGSYTYNPAFEYALKLAASYGTLLVTSAGNDGQDNDSIPHYPEAYRTGNIISVAMTKEKKDKDELDGFSNYGATSVDVGAPGVDIESALASGYYASLTGTSMAAPFVAGTASIMKAVNPCLTPAQIRQIVVATCDDKDVLDGKIRSDGRLNAKEAVLSAQATATSCEQLYASHLLAYTSSTVVTALSFGPVTRSPDGLDLYANDVAVPSSTTYVYPGSQTVLKMIKYSTGIMTAFSGAGIYYSPDGNYVGGGGITTKRYDGIQTVTEMIAYGAGIITAFSGAGIYYSPDGNNLGGGGSTTVVYSGSQLVKAMIVYGGGVITAFSGAGIYRSPDGTYLGGGGSTTVVYSGSQLVRAMIPYDGGVITAFSGAGIYYSPDGNYLGGGGSTTVAYSGSQLVVAMIAFGGGVITAFNGGGIYFSPNGSNLGGGGSTTVSYSGSQLVTAMIPYDGGVLTAFSGGGVYFSPNGNDLGGGGMTTRVD